MQTIPALNPLVGACSPILITISQINELPAAPPQLKETLIYEINQFVLRMKEVEYPITIVLAARYLTCCFIDDYVMKAHWNKAPDDQYRILPTFHPEPPQDEHFFALLARCAKEPNIYIDLLELGYLLLSLGFLGKNKKENFMDEIYQVIRMQRGDPTKQLLLAKTIPQKSSFSWLKSLGITLLLSFICLVVINFASHLYLTQIKSFAPTLIKGSGDA